MGNGLPTRILHRVPTRAREIAASIMKVELAIGARLRRIDHAGVVGARRNCAPLHSSSPPQLSIGGQVSGFAASVT
jgi:hypothetical protein